MDPGNQVVLKSTAAGNIRQLQKPTFFEEKARVEHWIIHKLLNPTRHIDSAALWIVPDDSYPPEPHKAKQRFSISGYVAPKWERGNTVRLR